MTCRINCNMGIRPNISLQWLYASQEENAGLTGMVLEDGHSSNVRFNYSETVLMTPGNQFIVAILELHHEFEIGYYWCGVTGGRDTLNQNPSRVIRISSTCYSGIDCGRDTLGTPQQASSRCANGNFAENITILDVQDTSACLVPRTDGPLATTEGDARTETTTQGRKVIIMLKVMMKAKGELRDQGYEGLILEPIFSQSHPLPFHNLSHNLS